MDINSLSYKKKILFALCLVERILHFYEDFNKQWGNKGYKKLQGYIQKIYDDVENNTFNIDNSIRIEIEELIPDSDEYDSIEALFAQNTSISMVYIIDFIKEKNERYLAYIIQKIVETIDIIQIEKYDNNDNIAIKNEYESQNELILLLKELNEDITRDEINKIRTFAKNNIIKF